ncbi:pirin family protein [Flavobacteriaceae bacterium]|nr:pirin family protein [Flavobacteriaceae bacterium]
MPIKVFTKENQANGNFNNGQILEKKPIGFPQDGGQLSPYSNLFYWAHAWAPGNDSTIGLHPHRGFEICSFVLKGEIEHYDTLLEKWITLKKGDVQIIKAGKGISHSEKLKSDSEIFQIWFDPNIQESLYIEASYNDFKSEEFKLDKNNGVEIKTISNNENQLGLDSVGVKIFESSFTDGENEHIIEENCYHSMFILSGNLNLKDQVFSKGDFIIVDNEKKIQLSTKNNCKIFEIISPIKLPYKTYAEVHNVN